MAYVYAYLIMNGTKTIDQVPAKMRDKVKAALEELGVGDLAE